MGTLADPQVLDIQRLGQAAQQAQDQIQEGEEEGHEARSGWGQLEQLPGFQY